MHNSRLDRIINEEVSNVINEGVMDDIGQLIAKTLNKIGRKKKKRNKLKDKEAEKKREEKDDKPDIRKKKVVGGGTKDYNYDDYQEKHVKVNTADYHKIADSIDQENTDIAAVAREVFPDHTDEGAQSQLRKILNGERPMTEPIAEKLRELIAKGQVAVK
jgi:hypothetical protein